MNVVERVKFATYRLPVVRRLMAPKYPFKVDPGELAAMIGFINATRGTNAAVCEIGVAQGDSSVFFLQHMKTTADPRPVYLFDTFSGFTPESVEVEVERRGKEAHHYDKFRYGDEDRFRRNLTLAGYSNFETVRGDASKFDWSSIAPIGAVLLDIDLYQPTIDIVRAIYPHLAPDGGIVIDDCVPNNEWDGSLQAYEEFITENGLPFERVSHDGAVIRKS